MDKRSGSFYWEFSDTVPRFPNNQEREIFSSTRALNNVIRPHRSTKANSSDSINIHSGAGDEEGSGNNQTGEFIFHDWGTIASDTTE